MNPTLLADNNAPKAATSSASTTGQPATFYSIAKPLIDRGLSIIPVKPKEKKPLLGATSRTNNAETLAAWADVYPNANVGIVADENFTILETDNEQKFRDTVRQITGNEIPVTACSTSGRPNRCAWIFKRTQACLDNCPVVPGIFEFRNKNQYVVGPGSIHPSSSTYHWKNDAPIAEFPSWLMPTLEQMAAAYSGTGTGTGIGEHVKTGAVATLREAYLANLEPHDMLKLDKSEVVIGQDERHYTLMSVAGFLHDGDRSEDDIANILIEVRGKFCDEGGREVDDSEVYRIAEWVTRREPFQAEPTNIEAFAEGTIAFGSQTDLDVYRDERKKSWRTLFHTKSQTVDAPPITFAIDGFLQEGGVTMLGGKPGHGKTLFALAMAKSLVTGTPLFGHFVVPRKSERVIYLIPESGLTPFASRLRTFGLTDHVEEDFFYRTFSIADEEDILLTDSRMREACRGADVFLDTAVRFMEGDENASSEQKVFAKNLFSLLKAGARTVTGLHHSPKSFERDNYMSLENVLRGSGDIGAMLAGCWGSYQIDKATNRLFIENVKARDFLPCEPFIIEGRPFLDTTGAFKMINQPGTAGSFNSYKPRNQSGRPVAGKQDKQAEAKRLKATGLSNRQIAAAIGVDHKTVGSWTR